MTVAAVAAACGGESPADGGGSLDDADAPLVQAEEIWRSSEELLLSGVSDLAVDSRGRVYVADRDAGILLLSADGDSLRSIGRKGGGPGEYEFIGSLQVIEGDSLLTFDPSTRRISVFGPDSGEFAYAHTLREVSATQWIRQLARIEDGPLYLALFPPPSDPMTGEEQEDGLSVVRLIDETGTVDRDSLLVFQPARGLVATEESGGRIRGRMWRRNPLSWEPVVHLKADRIYYGRTDSLAIHVYDLTGNRIGGFSIAASPEPISDDAVENVIESMREIEGPVPGEDMTWVTDQWIEQLRESIPEHWPLYDSFLVDDRGRFWRSRGCCPRMTRESLPGVSTLRMALSSEEYGASSRLRSAAASLIQYGTIRSASRPSSRTGFRNSGTVRFQAVGSFYQITFHDVVASTRSAIQNVSSPS